MTEKKTFKNVSSVINTFDPEHTWVVEGFRMKSNEFTHREWDMEVTFTKKPEQFKTGDKVTVAEGYYGPYEVLGVSEYEIWLKDRDGDTTLWDLDINDIRKV